MKKYVNDYPVWMIVGIISTISIIIVIAISPLILNVPTDPPYRFVLLSLCLPTFLISVGVGTTVVYSYKKIIEENHKMIERLGKDHLTGLLNRHTFYDFYNRKIKTLKENNKSIALLMVDIDNFKNINDTYGHLAGDAVIKDVSRHLRQSVREDDLLCRFGGEEFMAVMCCLKFEDAKAIGERLLRSMCTSLLYEESAIAYSVSIGLIYYGRCCGGSEEMIRQVDMLMYQAKSKGKNRIVCQMD